MSILDLIKSGGWVMYPLFLSSIVLWGIVVERFLMLRKWQEKNREFLLSFSNLWLRGDRESAQRLCGGSVPTDLALIAGEAFSEAVSKKTDLGTRLERKRLERSQELKKFLWLLGTIGSAAPFIGLFGTVVGIIRAFQAMAQTGSGGFAVVAAGISEALVATAAGILVAVVALFFYNFFQTRVNRMQFQLKLLTEELFETISGSNTEK